MLPKLLDSRLRSILSQADYESAIAAFANKRMASFRVNTLKSSVAEVEAIIKREGFRVSRFEAIQGTYLLDPEDEYRFKGSELFRQGKTYLQSLSSMLPPLAFDFAPGTKVLDVCAAPGSKTTQMAALMQNSGSIIALEQSPIRFDKLMHNARLQGANNIEGVRTDARTYMEKTDDRFDAILLDAPCSAEGRIRLDDERSYGFFSLENIRKKAALQYELLSAAFRILGPNGTLVYATCTLAPEENEGVISKLLESNPDASVESLDFPFAEIRPGMAEFSGKSFHPEVAKTIRVIPSVNFEGFYIAKLRKRGI